MNVAHNTTNDQIFHELYALFEWAFDVRFTPDDRSIFETEVFRGWDNADDTDRDLIAYLLAVKDAVWSGDPARRRMVKPKARDLFRKAFGIRESNDRGRIVATLHSLIERRSPGVSGVTGAAPLRTVPQLTVPQPVVPASIPQPAVPNVMAHGTPTVLPDPAAGGPPLTADQIHSIKTRTNWDSQLSAVRTYMHDQEHQRIMAMFK